jgi:hypothetical protein
MLHGRIARSGEKSCEWLESGDGWRLPLGTTHRRDSAGRLPLIAANAPLIGDRFVEARGAPYTEREPMRRIFAVAAIVSLAWAQATGADRAPSWNKIHYLGGTVKAKVDRWDWNTTLTIRDGEIELVFNPHTTLRLKPSQVRSISYGQEAHRKVEDIVALGLVFPPLALFGVLHASKEQLVGIVYDTEDGKMGAVLLESPQFFAILQALTRVTGKTVELRPEVKH